jgi:outer membrane protein TolC
VAPAAAQTPLTLEEAMKRAQGETGDARALASTIDEAEARVQRAQSGFWPRVDLTETVSSHLKPRKSGRPSTAQVAVNPA